MRFRFLTLLLLFSSLLSAQNFHVGLFGGISNYQGDLVGKAFIGGRFAKPAVGITGQYDLSNRSSVRAGFTHAAIEGDDQYNSKDYLRLRNLSFATKINELSLLLQYNLFNQDDVRWTPYVFGGAAVFHFNPYTYDANGEKTYLKPLSTEGQGLAEYPDRKPYALTQVALPFGGGVKFYLTNRISIGLEGGIRKTFTDYLDDVSTNYADEADLLAARGPKAVELSYRGDEVPGGNGVYPAKNEQRGGATQKDIYYFTGLHLTYRIGSGLGPAFGGRKGKKRLDCPPV